MNRKNRKLISAIALIGLIAMIFSLLASVVRAAGPAGPVVEMAYMALAPAPGEDSLRVLAIYAVSNPSAEPIERLEFPLPAGFEELSALEGVVKPEPSETALIDGDGLAPGSAKRLILTYQVPAPNGRLDLIVPSPYPVSEFIVAAPKQGVELTAEGFEAAAETRLDGAPWRQWVRSDLAPDTRILLQMRLTAGSAPAVGAQPPPRAAVDPSEIIGHSPGAGVGKALAHVLLILGAFALAIKGAAA